MQLWKNPVLSEMQIAGFLSVKANIKLLPLDLLWFGYYQNAGLARAQSIPLAVQQVPEDWGF